jgi:hypothetical protein
MAKLISIAIRIRCFAPAASRFLRLVASCMRTDFATSDIHLSGRVTAVSSSIASAVARHNTQLVSSTETLPRIRSFNQDGRDVTAVTKATSFGQPPAQGSVTISIRPERDL